MGDIQRRARGKEAEAPEHVADDAGNVRFPVVHAFVFHSILYRFQVGGKNGFRGHPTVREKFFRISL
jgi:hypothetical protein